MAEAIQTTQTHSTNEPRRLPTTNQTRTFVYFTISCIHTDLLAGEWQRGLDFGEVLEFY